MTSLDAVQLRRIADYIDGANALFDIGLRLEEYTPIYDDDIDPVLVGEVMETDEGYVFAGNGYADDDCGDGCGCELPVFTELTAVKGPDMALVFPLKVPAETEIPNGGMYTTFTIAFDQSPDGFELFRDGEWPSGDPKFTADNVDAAVDLMNHVVSTLQAAGIEVNEAYDLDTVFVNE